MDGVRTKKLVIEPTEAAFVRQMYEMYADPPVSLHDITKKLTADGMRTYHGRPLSRACLLYTSKKRTDFLLKIGMGGKAILGLSRLDYPSAKTGEAVNGGA